jgi:hypothetical protein
MAFNASLQLDGNTYDLRNVRIYLGRGKDQKGRPLINAHWYVTFILDAIKDTVITEWMIDPYKKMDGKITIRCREGNKEIEFKEAFCTGMTDEFNPSINVASCECNIEGKEIVINSTPYIPNWLATA